jgi:hypothetical protein
LISTNPIDISAPVSSPAKIHVGADPAGSTEPGDAWPSANLRLVVFLADEGNGRVPAVAERQISHEQRDIEGFAEAIAHEAAPFGIDITIVEPGGADLPRSFVADNPAGQGLPERMVLTISITVEDTAFGCAIGICSPLFLTVRRTESLEMPASSFCIFTILSFESFPRLRTTTGTVSFEICLALYDSSKAARSDSITPKAY